MGKDRLERNSSREGKARERSKRKSNGKASGRQFRRNDVLPTLRIESYPIEALKTHVRKLRKNDSAHIREIASSINALGFNVPVLVGKGNVVVDGASRLAAANLLLGLITVQFCSG
ncbi:ParB N-terminal domain-containing protein [Bradyrhizobium sp.]|jgi:hypothetical protein|uniref:ParB N-terminal domain-containing protein n=2 Tax=Bradyrhizobium sp. TaxID=376 RepID=UPI003BAF960C